MKYAWNVTDIKIGDYSPLRHKVTKELGFFGIKGQVWFYNHETIAVLIYHSNYEKVSFQPIEMIGQIIDDLLVPRLSSLHRGLALRSYYNNPEVA